MNTKNSSFLKKRRLLFRWASWFFLANIVILLFIGLNYVRMMPSFQAVTTASTGGRVFAYVFLIFAFITQFTVVSFGAYCVSILTIAFFPRRQVVLPLSVVLATAIALFFIADSIIYHLYHLHLAGVVWHIFLLGVANDVLALSWLEWLIVAGLALVFLLIETLFAYFIWKRIKDERLKGCGYVIPAILTFIILASYTTMLTALSSRTRNAVYLSNIHLLEIGAQFVPYYNDILGFLIPTMHARLFLQLMGGGFFYQPPQITKPLNYPLHAMQCTPRKKPYNIVIIMLDAWRFDMLNAEIAPNIYRFSRKADTFFPHLSGGNCTGPGVFSLFYSIPYTYWTSVLQQKKSPVLMNELLKQQYQMGIFVSASLHYPAFDETIFRKVKNLRIKNPGKYSYQNDQYITQEFKHFLKQRDSTKPFFSFIFYDTTHNYCEKPDAYPRPFKPAPRVCNRVTLTKDTNPIPLMNVYKNAIRFDDQLAGQVLSVLKKEQLLKNTIVIITADHGEQFNDNRKGIWGHASDYTRWQLQVPLIVYRPGKATHRFNYFTSHYDIVPFLMKEQLGCSNNVRDYSIGKSLLTPQKNINLFATSYIDYALVQNNRITRIYPNGNIRIYNNKGDDIKGASLNAETAKTFFSIMNEYYQSAPNNQPAYQTHRE
jgi:membrane-anchored protein YejM (alkaline phosphatase superfamily)